MKLLGLSVVSLALAFVLVVMARPSQAFLGRGTMLETEGDIFGIYCDDFDRSTRVWHHREITREAVRRVMVDYFKVGRDCGTDI